MRECFQTCLNTVSILIISKHSLTRPGVQLQTAYLHVRQEPYFLIHFNIRTYDNYVVGQIIMGMAFTLKDLISYIHSCQLLVWSGGGGHMNTLLLCIV